MLTAPTISCPDLQSDATRERAELVEGARLIASAQTLAAFIADQCNIDFEQVVAVYRVVPNNLVSLLDTPQGWAVLADMVAAVALVDVLPVLPTRH